MKKRGQRKQAPATSFRFDGEALLFPELSENPWPAGTARTSDPLRTRTLGRLTTLELCAGAGGQALGFEQAGIDHAGLLEVDHHACTTLRLNRPERNVLEGDMRAFDGASFKGVDIISGGLPCPPFSIAGKQLGKKDERNLFPAMIRLVDQVRPRAVMIENVRGILESLRGCPRHRKEELLLFWLPDQLGARRPRRTLRKTCR